MNLGEFETAVFGIRPLMETAERSCQVLRRYLHLALSMAPNESARRLLIGYRSILSGLLGVAIAQDEGRYDEAQGWLMVARDGVWDARFTHGWTQRGRYCAFGIDFAVVSYLMGYEVEARRNYLRSAMQHGHPVARFMAARMYIEGGRPIQIKHGSQLLSQRGLISRLSNYSEEFAQLATEIADFARRGHALTPEYRITPQSLGWWANTRG